MQRKPIGSPYKGFRCIDDHNNMTEFTATQSILSWSRLSEQLFRVDKWSLCRG